MSLMRPIKQGLARVLGGGGDYSVTVPVMDGPLKPNDVIEATGRVAQIPGGANIAEIDGTLVASRGPDLLTVSASGEAAPRGTYDADITALAVSDRGAIALGLSGRGVVIENPDGTRRHVDSAGDRALNCVTALAFLPDGALAITNGSADFAPEAWFHDLMHHGASGVVAVLDPGADTATLIATGLRYPSGICPIDGSADRLAVSEAWRHRLVEISRTGRKVVGDLTEELPLYPSRIVPLRDGGYALCNLSVRSQLIEFVLRERRYLRRMIREVPPEFWIAPALSSKHSFKEPLQAGGVIRLGIHKPWAPTRSYGAIVGLTPDFHPAWSAHSRADGHRHGVTSLVQTSQGLVALAQGNGDLFAISETGTPLAQAEDTAKDAS
jgi:hypothetical protein